MLTGSGTSGYCIYFNGSEWELDKSVRLTFNNSYNIYTSATVISNSNGLQYAIYCSDTDVYAAHFENGKLTEEKIEGITSTATNRTSRDMQKITVNN